MDGAAAARDVGDIEQVTRGGSGGRRRAVTVAFAGMGLLVLVACAAGGGWGSPGATSLAASSGNLGTPDRWVPGGALRGKALAAVKRMYAANPEFVKEFASLTGRGGNALLNELKGPAVGSSAGVKQRQQQLVQPVIPPDAILGEDMQMLNFALAASDNSTDGAAQGEGGAEGAVEAEVDGGGAADPLALTDAESAEKGVKNHSSPNSYALGAASAGVRNG
ncbi:hypothetical protein T484DRAFT_1786258 [Baffinella frigidus]|nr:hypothetical protein T484DRAFT_1786258 [Cryptophyta sp. CCMP2293]